MPKIAARGGQLCLSKCQPRLEAPTNIEHKQTVQTAKQKQKQRRHVHEGDTAPDRHNTEPFSRRYTVSNI